MLAELLKGHRKEFIDLCSAHKVKALYAFGSVVHGPFTATSDVDLMVEVEKGPDDPEVGERLWSFWDALEAFFKRPVDLLTEASIRNPVRRHSIEAGEIDLRWIDRKPIMLTSYSGLSESPDPLVRYHR